MMKYLWLTLALCCASPSWAVLPDEMLADPALEARARHISLTLRCPVCQSENIDDSNADIARDLRLLVRQKLQEGLDDRQVVDFIVARYGEYVLFEPNAQGMNLLLWLAGPLMLGGGIMGSLIYVKRRHKMADLPALSAQEQARLDEILKK